MSSQVKVGVVGCGVVATAYYLPYLMRQSDAEITAVCDTNGARAAACQRLFGAKAQFVKARRECRRAGGGRCIVVRRGDVIRPLGRPCGPGIVQTRLL